MKNIKSIGLNSLLVVLVVGLVIGMVKVSNYMFNDAALQKKDITHSAMRVIDENEKLQKQIDDKLEHLINDVHEIQDHFNIVDYSRDGIRKAD